ncbi:MAG: recombination mediator RecR [Rikenellaceae bacterium]
MSKLLDNLVCELSSLPGVGKRTALRLALNLLRRDLMEVEQLSSAIYDFRSKICYCTECNNLSDEALCPVCQDSSRDKTTICVVEQVGDLLSVENSRQFKGLYHVLGGVISPMQGIAPSDLKIDMLLNKLEQNQVKEVILALGTSIEAETTHFFLARRLQKFPDIKVTSIARGIGFGDELEYADEITIGHAIHNRTMVK